MGSKAEELGFEIYPGFAASEVLLFWLSCYAQHTFRSLYDHFSNSSDFKRMIKLLALEQMIWEISKDGSKKDNFQHGVELKGNSLSHTPAPACAHTSTLRVAYHIKSSLWKHT
ncbi:hypothetical protein CFOL_v3_32006 [Cephalotus follicularis]|uniref:Uncharacterized protein n=1 Tax=Cephalotus follicularis TaxID=3775 RepID=A0A1Q3D803_CEPFO|nr:hypothetical protein CFOL_v3_32006 [Cephalotus follicularis]